MAGLSSFLDRYLLKRHYIFDASKLTILKNCPVGKCKYLSEALIFAEHGENMLCIYILNVNINFCTQQGLDS